MFENIKKIFKKNWKKNAQKTNTKTAAKERLHLVLMQDRANVSADFLDLMRKEIIEVIKKYIDIDEEAMDVRLTTETDEEGKQGAPALYANIPIINIKDETRKLSKTNQENKPILYSNIIKDQSEGKTDIQEPEKNDKEKSMQTKDKKQTGKEQAESKVNNKQEENKTDENAQKQEDKKEKTKIDSKTEEKTTSNTKKE